MGERLPPSWGRPSGHTDTVRCTLLLQRCLLSHCAVYKHYYCKDEKTMCTYKQYYCKDANTLYSIKNTASSSCADAKMQACTLHLMLHHTIDGIHHRQCFYWFLPLFISPMQFIMICYWFVFACACALCICTVCTVQVLVAELGNCAVCISA